MNEWMNEPVERPVNFPYLLHTAETSLPSHYIRKSNSLRHNQGTPISPQQFIQEVQLNNNQGNYSTPCSSLMMADSGSAKKRWLRQAISEETEPINPGLIQSQLTCVTSRPDSPATAIDCLAPLKKRRLARASMSSEISNTPPLTPNNIYSHEQENSEQEQNHFSITPDIENQQSTEEVSKEQFEDISDFTSSTDDERRVEELTLSSSVEVEVEPKDTENEAELSIKIEDKSNNNIEPKALSAEDETIERKEEVIQQTT